MSEPKLKELEKAFDGNLDLVLFFVTWVKNGQNASKAYLELNPHVDPASARVLGSRQLAKVNFQWVMETYGLGLEEYLNQLKDGLAATKWNDFSGEREADHQTRRPYHDKLGKLLGVEKDNAQINITGDKVIAILGGLSHDSNNSNQEVTEAQETN